MGIERRRDGVSVPTETEEGRTLSDLLGPVLCEPDGPCCAGGFSDGKPALLFTN